MLKTLDLFSGIGGFSIGLERAGFETVAFCEIDKYCRLVLKKHWKDIKVYPDVREITKRQLRRRWMRTYLKSLQEASRASRLAWLEDKKDLGTIATSGLRCLESSKNLNPVGLLQKMSEALLTSNTAWSSNVCTLIWKVKATKRKRLLYQLQASVPRIAETESGLWLTPNSMDSLPPRNRESIKKTISKESQGQNNSFNTTGTSEVYPPPNKLWRTPDALSGGSNLPGIKKALNQGHLKRPSGQSIQILLARSSEREKIMADPNINREKWNQSENRKGSRTKQSSKDVADSKSQQSLSTDNREKQREKLATRNKANLEEVIAGHCGQQTGTLNPTWVEWLMGYKAGYTDLKDWEILLSRKLRKK